jgi:phage host-nuclease inhibitor protein Gam
MGKGRTKIASEPVLKSWEDVDLHLKEVGEIDIAVTELETEMNKQISDIKFSNEYAAQPLLERRKRLGMEIKAFVDEHKGEITGKTKVLNFGSTGFRKSTKLIIQKVKDVIIMLKAKGMESCVKKKESINREVLGTYTDEVLESVGVTRKKGDEFWFEPKYEKIKEV